LGLHRLAAKAQLLELVDQHSALQGGGGGDKVDEGAKSEVREQIVDISTNTNVISPFTSFVGVDPDKIGMAGCDHDAAWLSVVGPYQHIPHWKEFE
uniref:GAF domain-containing protein n=1 Tax=Taenia asiatica TaxID=60517 RepID=A0A0R3VZK5_TAEAS